MYDNVLVQFKDGSETQVWVHEDMAIADEVVELCERCGWNVDEVAHIVVLASGEELEGNDGEDQ